MLVLRSLLFNIVFYTILIVFMIVLLPSLVLGPRWVKAAARLWGRESLRMLRIICGTHVEFRGRHNIPPGGIVVAAKHQSMWEVFALITVFEDFAFVFKKELMWIPLFGWYLALGGQIAIDRKKGRGVLTELGRQARRVIAAGVQLFIFPEGTRRPPGAPPAYKSGVAYIYEDLKVPCLPVALNSGLFWQRRSFLRRPGTIVVDILPPIEPGLPQSDFLARLQEAIEVASDRLVAEALATDPSLERVMARVKAA